MMAAAGIESSAEAGSSAIPPCIQLSNSAHNYPDKPFLLFREAVSATEIKLTYSEVYRKALQWANWLNTQPQITAPKSNVVAVWMGDGVDHIVAMFAIWMLGKTYMPLPINPTTEQQGYPDKVDATCILIDSAEGKKGMSAWKETTLTGDSSGVAASGSSSDKEVAMLPLRPLKTPLLYLPKEKLESLDPLPPKPPEFHCTQEAYIFCSSGSTGNPKIIVNNFTGVSPRITSALDIMGVTENSGHHFLGYLSRAFDASLFDIFCALYSASSLYIVPEIVRGNAINQLGDFIHGCTEPVRPNIGVLVPSLLASLSPDKLSSMKTILTTGENIVPAQTAPWFEAGRRLFNGYGPTENTIGSTIIEMKKEDVSYPLVSRLSVSSPLVGVLEGAALYIREVSEITVAGTEETYSDGEHSITVFGPLLALDTAPSCDPDKKYELVIGGLGVGHYHETVESKHHDRFLTIDGQRFFNTRDQVSWDGLALKYEGRFDRQIKRAGQLVNMDDIESRIEAVTVSEGNPIKLIVQAIIKAFPRPTGAEAVVAFIFPAPDLHLSPAEIRHRYAQSMASKDLDARYRPDMTFWLIKAPVRDKKVRQDADLLALGLLPIDVATDVSEIGTQLRITWYNLVVPDEFKATGKFAAAGYKPENIPLDASLEELGGTSLTKPRLIDQLIKTYQPPHLPEALESQFESDIKDYAFGSHTLRDFEMLINQYFSFVAFHPLELRDTERPLLYLKVPCSCPEIYQWLDTYVKQANRPTSDKPLSFILPAHKASAKDIWSELEVPFTALSGRLVRIFVTDADTLPMISDLHEFLQKRDLGGVRLQWVLMVPGLQWVPAEFRSTVVSLVPNETSRIVANIPGDVGALFQSGLQRYGDSLSFEPRLDTFIAYLKQFYEAYKKHPLLTTATLWDSLLPPAQDAQTIGHLSLHPYFAFLSPWLDVAENGSVTWTVEFSVLEELEAFEATHSPVAAPAPALRAMSKKQLAVVPWLPIEDQPFVRQLKSGHAYPPVILIHPLTGDIPTIYGKIADSMVEGQAVYAIQGVTNPSFETFGDQVAYYAALVKKLAPQGNAFLMGWSYGGLLSYAIAAKLESDGVPVAVVVNIDSAIAPHIAVERMKTGCYAVALEMAEHFITQTFQTHTDFKKTCQSLITKEMPDLRSIDLEKSDTTRRMLLKIGKHYAQEWKIAGNIQGAELLENTFIHLAFHLSLLYTRDQTLVWPKLSETPMLFIRAQESLSAEPGRPEVSGWRDLVLGDGNLIETPCPGNHFTLFEHDEFFKILQEQFNKKLREFEAQRLQWLMHNIVSDYIKKNNTTWYSLCVISPPPPPDGALFLHKSFNDQRVISVEGPRDSGTSNLMALSIKNISDCHKRDKLRYPEFFLPLKWIVGQTLEQQLYQWGFSEEHLKNLKEQENLYIVLDGFPVRRNQALIEELKSHWPKAKFILVCEREIQYGIYSADEPSYPHYFVKPMKDEEVKYALMNFELDGHIINQLFPLILNFLKNPVELNIFRDWLLGEIGQTEVKHLMDRSLQNIAYLLEPFQTYKVQKVIDSMTCMPRGMTREHCKVAFLNYLNCLAYQTVCDQVGIVNEYSEVREALKSVDSLTTEFVELGKAWSLTEWRAAKFIFSSLNSGLITVSRGLQCDYIVARHSKVREFYDCLKSYPRTPERFSAGAGVGSGADITPFLSSVVGTADSSGGSVELKPGGSSL
jgi:acyl-CoA synthetase (AMP-forming)/AMP-acid ligase II/thioesterase domain-containing protein